MAASTWGAQLWSMSGTEEEIDVYWDRPPSPPLLLLGEASSGGEEEDADRDGTHGVLVIGRDLPLPGHSPAPLLGDVSWCDYNLPRGLQGEERFHENVQTRSNNDQRKRVLGELEKRGGFSGPSQGHSGNELSQRVAEVASQLPGWQAGEQEDFLDHPNTSTRLDLWRFDVRKSTFPQRNWPRDLPPAEQLARAGFYYLGMEDRVSCFSCGVQLEEWGEEDPLARHYHASPNCAFLLRDFPEQLESLRPAPAPRQSQYSNTSLRLHSFAHWPLSAIVTSYQLASVGFYYTGEGSKVICFSCGLEVREWKRGDVPLLVHCRSNPDCTFIKSIIKGAPLSENAPAPVHMSLATNSSSRPNYSDEQVRLQSFKKLSPAFPIPRRSLAEAGLFLLRLPDVMKCHSCEVVLQGWVEEDTPVEKHRQATSHCPFLAEKFPSKLSSPPPVDPSCLPAAEFDERELELMAHQQPTLTSHTPHHLSDFFTGLSLSDPHTLTSSQPPSLSNTPQSVPHLSTASPVLSAPSSGVVGGKPVSLPPSYSERPSPHSLASADTRQQPMSLPAGAECVVCMDKPLEMVFVPCGHICACEECSSQITRCPICRTRTQMAVKVYFPY